MKTLLVLENDSILPVAIEHYIREYKEKYPDCKVIVLTELSYVDSNTLIGHIKDADTIAVQSQFIDDSYYQLISIAEVLAKMPSKDVVINNNNLQHRLQSILNDELLDSITHHNIFKMESARRSIMLNFDSHLKEYREKIAFEKKYKDEARFRVIGKVRIINCVAFSPVCTNLPIGDIVDRLDMSKLDNQPQRGVWIQGNGEPFKLVNDLGTPEFEIITSLDTEDQEKEIVSIICNSLSITMSDEQHALAEKYVKKAFRDNRGLTVMANEICEYLDIAKRGNRSAIVKILNKYFKIF